MLHNYVKRAFVDNCVEKLHARHPTTLSVSPEEELIEVLLSEHRTCRLFGLSPKVVNTRFSVFVRKVEFLTNLIRQLNQLEKNGLRVFLKQPNYERCLISFIAAIVF